MVLSYSSIRTLTNKQQRRWLGGLSRRRLDLVSNYSYHSVCLSVCLCAWRNWCLGGCVRLGCVYCWRNVAAKTHCRRMSLRVFWYVLLCCVATLSWRSSYIFGGVGVVNSTSGLVSHRFCDYYVHQAIKCWAAAACCGGRCLAARLWCAVCFWFVSLVNVLCMYHKKHMAKHMGFVYAKSIAGYFFFETVWAQLEWYRFDGVGLLSGLRFE